MSITWIKAADENELGERGAAYIADLLQKKPAAALLLPTGETPVPVYRTLAVMQAAGRVSFEQVRTVNLDEYVGLGPDDPQSYHAFMQRQLFGPVGMRPEQSALPDGAAADLTAACRAYDAHIAALGGLDLALVGVGRNGHVGFNEPDDSFPIGTHVVDLTDSTVQANARLFDSAAEVPRQALTVGVDAIMQAREILLVAGPDKRQVVETALSGPVTPRLPVSVLRLHPRVTVIHVWKR